MTEPKKRTIAVTNVKGGAGKTMTAMYVTAALHRKGFNPMLLDADDQRSATRWASYGQRRSDPLPFPVVAMDSPIRDHIEAHQGWVVIDLAPGDGERIDESIALADHVVIPSRDSSDDADQAVATAIFCIESDVRHTILLSVRRPATTTATRDDIRFFAADNGLSPTDINVSKTEIPILDRFKNSFGRTPVDLDPFARFTNSVVRMVS